MFHLFALALQRLKKARDYLEHSDRLKEPLPISMEYWLEWILVILVLTVGYTVARLLTSLIQHTPASVESMALFLFLCVVSSLVKNISLGLLAEQEAHLLELNRPEIELDEQQLHRPPTRAWMAASAHRLTSRDELQALSHVNSFRARDDQDCMICLDALHSPTDRAQVTQLPCNHAFHHDCLTPWLAQSFTCAQCTREMVWVSVFKKDLEQAEASAAGRD